jgi:predicted nucleic acid-binding Zn ribbon protein
VAPRDPKAGQPQLVGDLLARFLRRSGLSGRVAAASALSDWAEIVGPQIASVTRAHRLSGDTLFVAVRTSAWMMELNLMKADLLGRLNAGRQEGRIERIVFVMDDGSG